MLLTPDQKAESVTKILIYLTLAVLAIWWGWYRKDKRNKGPKPDALQPKKRANDNQQP
jgi:hypothetical protein